MRLDQGALAACLLLIAAHVSRAQNSFPTDQQLYVSGHIGYALGNCVKASRYWFAYLLRNPPELDATRRAAIERVIAVCDTSPEQIAYTYAQFAKKPPDRCEKYAELAVAQFEAAQLAGCGFSGSRWSGNRAYHHKWCTTAREAESNRELSERRTQIVQCAPNQ
jgi:hypothetical protein